MLNLKSEDKGTWFYFDEENPDAGGVCLRELRPDEIRKIEELSTTETRKWKRKDGAWAVIKKVDEDFASRKRFDAVIVDWKKVAIDGQEIKCTKPNKVRAMKIVSFIKFVVDSLLELSESNKELEEARVKNSETSPDGSSGLSAVKPAKSST